MNTLSGGSVIHMEGILFVLSNFLIITFTNNDDFNPIKTSDEVYTSLGGGGKAYLCHCRWGNKRQGLHVRIRFIPFQVLKYPWQL